MPARFHARRLLGRSIIFPALPTLLCLLPFPARAADFYPANPAEFINDINTANVSGEADTVYLSDTTCSFEAVDNIVCGNNALPVISSIITIEGNGAVPGNTGGGGGTAEGGNVGFGGGRGGSC